MPAAAAESPKTPFAVGATYIPIAGTSDMFPVRRIYCIGRNYAAHAREMGSDPNREPPFFFQKPTDAIHVVPPGETIDHPYPTLTKNYHYEIELVAALNKGGRNIVMDRALDYVFGYTVGLDMTRRDLQRAMGDEKKPWEIGKSFESLCAARPPAASSPGATFHAGRHMAQGKWSDQAERQSEPDDLVGSAADQQALRSIRAHAWRHHLLGTPENVGLW